ncbi:oxidoreductase [Mesorhizobium loti]|uniref:SDR family NAD(P)-dependent oxidoreductase n=1 Tax=Mesorhizobium loti R88b TaxID=935548 RepID=A0A6M7WJI2_RHILI|nr:oxidoreductase [Mesorhizobium loti]QKD04180.1 SDR family NAD(P)-dependent oxidoreductase [Mesorhizobium loti R88b]
MKVWFITGASRGFGALVAERALANGDAVVATARDSQKIVERFGDRSNLLPVTLDVTDETQARAAADAAVRKFGRIDVLLNNAGYGLLGAVEEASAEEIEALYRTNVFGLLAVTRAVLPHMRRERAGHIINISSVGGISSFSGWGVYGSTKFAVEGLSEALSMELAPLRIHVTVVEPGFFRTDFLDASSLVTSTNRIADYHETSGAMRQTAIDANHNQPGNPDKLAKVIVDIGNLAEPPFRLPLGSDTVTRSERRITDAQAMLKQWRDVAVSTDFEPMGAAAWAG